MAHSIRLWLETQMYWVPILAVSDFVIELTVTELQIVQRYGVCSAVYGTVVYKEPSHSIRAGHSPDFALPSVALFA